MVTFLSTVLVAIIGSILATQGISYLNSYLKKNDYYITITNFTVLVNKIYAIFAFIFLAFAYGDFGAVLASVFLAIGILAAFSDYFSFKIPNLFSLLVFIASIISTFSFCFAYSSIQFLYNFLIVFSIIFLFTFFSLFCVKNIGAGDIKLYFGYFCWIGSFNPFYALYSYILSVILLLVYILVTRKPVNKENPFAPFIVTSTLIIWLFMVSNTYTLTYIVTQ